MAMINHLYFLENNYLTMIKIYNLDQVLLYCNYRKYSYYTITYVAPVLTLHFGGTWRLGAAITWPLWVRRNCNQPRLLFIFAVVVDDVAHLMNKYRWRLRENDIVSRLTKSKVSSWDRQPSQLTWGSYVHVIYARWRLVRGTSGLLVRKCTYESDQGFRRSAETTLTHITTHRHARSEQTSSSKIAPEEVHRK